MKYKLISFILAISMIFVIGCKSTEVTASLSLLDKNADSFDGTIVLSRPTNNAMTVSINSNLDSEVYLQWGEKSNVYTEKSEIKTSSKTLPAVLLMNNLLPNKVYYYSLYFKSKGSTTYEKTKEYEFNTPRSSGVDYNFVIQSDSHLLNKADKDTYEKNMGNMANVNPDFIFDLGDTFLNDQKTDASAESYENIAETYRQQLPYFDIVTRNSPLFLTIGNHEGEYGSFLKDGKDSLAAKSTIARTTYYKNPIPNEFYTGNSEKEENIGYAENYYAFTWGDALYVSIDPYRYSDVTPYGKDESKDGWSWTLGKEQYDWFKETLENSDAKYKFVFSHHAIGNFRGGAEIAKLYEWGGYDQKGKYLFDEKRPGWGKPIQQIMKDAGVTIFFQGHDHLFAREVVDGVVYQTLPKPAEKIADAQSNFDAYPNADLLLNSGFLNVSVKSEGVQVDYIRNYFVSSDSQEGNTGVVYSYTVDSDHNVKVLKYNKDNISNYGKNTESIEGNKDTKNKDKSNQGNKGNKGNKGSKGDGSNPNGSNVNIGVGATAASAKTVIPKDGFSFAIQADSHLDENTDVNLYNQTLAQIKGDNPSFLMDLGDTSMAEKLASTQEEVDNRYNLAKTYLNNIGNIPLYMVSGNHDGENGFNGGKSQLLQWARADRLRYFPFPSSTVNFSGNIKTANYYSFTKNNAQFIVLDPYTYTTEKVGQSGNGWASTLGKTQYDWLKNTLASSKAQYKFVFIHNLAGGQGKDQRGGAEAASFYEWGGYNEQGIYEFDKMRSGWDMPIHNLLLKYNVNAVFHGHDHFYGKQEKDGIIYQLVPQPGTPGNSVYDALNYGYKEGTFLPSAGYLRVVVSNDKVICEYIKTETNGNTTIPNIYTIP